MNMPKVYMALNFLESFSRIPRAQQKRVRDFYTLFCENPRAPSIHYEPLYNVRDDRVRTVRIDQAYRAVLLQPETGADVVLIWVDHHDAAMAWAANKVFPVNPFTGAVQIVDLALVEEFNHAAAELRADKPLEAYALFETFADQDLLRAGVPPPLLPSVRALATVDELVAFERYLPKDVYEVLFWIAAEGCSVDVALDLASIVPMPGQVNPVDLGAALAGPNSQGRFCEIESPSELMEILDAPLERWRIFLHPSQAQLVHRRYNGPARVLGGAGTGKTVVAMHRARHLAQTTCTAPGDRVLFTTYTRNLAANIRQNLETLCGPEFARIEVTHLHNWAMNYLRRHGRAVDVASDDEIAQCWRNAVTGAGTLPWHEPFFVREWTYVVHGQDVTDRSAYLTTPRVGQGTALTRPQRDRVWSVLERYQEELHRLGKEDWPGVIRQARRMLSERDEHPYRAIVVDETQDLQPAELRLLRQMAAEGPDDLFLVGDAHQRIYGRPVVLAQCGIHVRGRSAKLRINYRTTEEIRRWAVDVLAGTQVDDLDGGEDNNRAYLSLLHGPRPTRRGFGSLEEECRFLVDELSVRCKVGAAEHICIVARSHTQLRNDYLPALRRAGIPYLYLEAETPEYAGSGVRLATMHRVKGLEFAHVFIVGMNAAVMPAWQPELADDPVERQLHLQQERCLLHVAATRARESLTITGWGAPSSLM